MTDCPSRFKLVQLQSGDLTPQETNRIENHLGGCVACRAVFSKIQENAAEYEKKTDAHLAQLKAQLTASSSPKFQKLWLPSLAFATASIILILVLILPSSDPPPDNYIAFKGEFSFQVVAKRDSEQFIVQDSIQLTKGDLLRFSIVTKDPGYLSIFSVNGAGQISPFYPEVEPQTIFQPLRLEESGRQELPGSIILDDWIGTEYLVVVFSNKTFDRRQVHQSIKDWLKKKITTIKAKDLNLEGYIEIISIQKVTQ
jgi:hypothetical protein